MMGWATMSWPVGHPVTVHDHDTPSKSTHGQDIDHGPDIGYHTIAIIKVQWWPP